MMMRTILLLFACLVLAAGCSTKSNVSADAGKPSQQGAADNQELDGKALTGRSAIAEPANLLANPGFELGLDGWKWLDWSKGWAAFKLSNTHAYEGLQALHLPVFSADQRPTVVWGGVQELSLPDEIPECIEGYYYVENWAAGNWKQYLQLVVIDLSHDLGKGQGQAQLRYIISGSKEPPLSISNAQYLFIEKERRDTPVLGKWTHFSVNPRADFMSSWNYKPQKGANLRVLFEGRFDYHKTAVPARADVYFDNLYFGPKTATRCAE
jgi:hypothetical protein